MTIQMAIRNLFYTGRMIDNPSLDTENKNIIEPYHTSK